MVHCSVLCNFFHLILTGNKLWRSFCHFTEYSYADCLLQKVKEGRKWESGRIIRRHLQSADNFRNKIRLDKVLSFGPCFLILCLEWKQDEMASSSQSVFRLEPLCGIMLFSNKYVRTHGLVCVMTGHAWSLLTGLRWVFMSRSDLNEQDISKEDWRKSGLNSWLYFIRISLRNAWKTLHDSHIQIQPATTKVGCGNLSYVVLFLKKTTWITSNQSLFGLNPLSVVFMGIAQQQLAYREQIQRESEQIKGQRTVYLSNKPPKTLVSAGIFIFWIMALSFGLWSVSRFHQNGWKFLLCGYVHFFYASVYLAESKCYQKVWLLNTLPHCTGLSGRGFGLISGLYLKS